MKAIRGQGYFTAQAANNGFVGIVFLVVAMIGIVLGGMAIMSRNSGQGFEKENLRSAVNVLRNNATDIKLSFERLIAGGANPDEIVMGSYTPNLFNVGPNDRRYAAKAVIPSELSSGRYYYGKTAKLPGIGSDAATEGILMLELKSERECRYVNHFIYNDSIDASPAVSTASDWELQGYGPADDTGSTAANYVGRAEGCITSKNGRSIYYKTLIER
jgi:hypothetical protein